VGWVGVGWGGLGWVRIRSGGGLLFQVGCFGGLFRWALSVGERGGGGVGGGRDDAQGYLMTPGRDENGERKKDMYR
jgi:hypothetical protein